MTSDIVGRTRLAHTEVRLLVKRGEFEAAHRLADSVLTARTDPEPGEVQALAGLAALTGRVHRTRALLEAEADDTTFAFWYEGERVTAPRPVTRAALALLAYASFPEPRDSTAALARRVRQLIDVWVPPGRRDRVRAATMMHPVTFGLWRIEPLSVLSIKVPGELNRLQRALAVHDLAAVRLAGKQLAASTPDERRGDVDVMYQQALVFLAVGDTTTAMLVLDDVLRELPMGPSWLLEDVHRAAAIPSAMGTRALLAARSGDTAVARPLARNVVFLWRDSDPELHPVLDSLRAIASPQ